MKVTTRLKNNLLQAQKDGYKRIYIVVGAYKATTYCMYYDISSLLAKPIGYDYGCVRPMASKSMWTGHPNTRMAGNEDIMYTQLFKKYDKEVE